MAFKKDYRLLYEAIKLDLQDQIKETERLRSSLDKEYERALGQDMFMRERIATEVHRQGWDADLATRMLNWIRGSSPKSVVANPVKSGGKKRRGRPRKIATVTVAVPKKGKRRYQKKSSYWKKK